MSNRNQIDSPLSGATGSGSFVGVNSPTLTTPALGTPTSGNLVNCTGLPGTALVYLSKQTASNSASLAFTSLISATYNNYLLILDSILAATDASVLLLQLSTNNGSSYLTTGYIGTNNYPAYNAGVMNATSVTTGFALSFDITSTAANGAYSGMVYLLSLQDGYSPIYVGNGTGYSSGLTASANALLSGNAGTNVNPNAFRLIMSSGNITSGYAVLYGIKATI